MNNFSLLENDTQTENRTSYKKWGAAILGAVAIAGVASYANSETMYDSAGNQMIALDNTQMQDILSEETDAWNTSVFPYHFWTKTTAAGKGAGWGLQSGPERLVFKSYHKKFMVAESNANANRAAIGAWEKFRVFYSSHCNKGGSDGLRNCLAFYSPAQKKWLSAQPNGNLDCNRAALGAWEKFGGWTNTKKGW